MKERSISICGFPGSGKTSYLAALWHLITTGAEPTALKFDSLRNGDATHLNEIAARWRRGLKQIRTETPSSKLVSMNLKNEQGDVMRLTLPDMSGESYRDMYEARECAPAVAEFLEGSEGMLLLVHADNIKQPIMVTTVVAQSQSLGSAMVAGAEVPWDPRLSPTQIQLVEFLQLLRLPPLNLSFNRMAIVLSAWDKVEAEGRSPEVFLAERMPLLQQYLDSKIDGWAWKVYGVTAQGGDYEKDDEPFTGAQLVRLNELKALDEPSLRIKVVSNTPASSDLTEPISWLMN
jgi:Double-GTPase 1